jgi:hypothetical protein
MERHRNRIVRIPCDWLLDVYGHLPSCKRLVQRLLQDFFEQRGLIKRTDLTILVWSVRARSPGPCTNRVYKASAFTDFLSSFFWKKVAQIFSQNFVHFVY